MAILIVSVYCFIREVFCNDSRQEFQQNFKEFVNLISKLTHLIFELFFTPKWTRWVMPLPYDWSHFKAWKISGDCRFAA